MKMSREADSKNPLATVSEGVEPDGLACES